MNPPIRRIWLFGEIEGAANLLGTAMAFSIFLRHIMPISRLAVIFILTNIFSRWHTQCLDTLPSGFSAMTSLTVKFACN